LGEFIRLKRELSEAFFIKQVLKNVTAIAIHADKIAVGSSNGTVINGKGKPDLKSVERIKQYLGTNTAMLKQRFITHKAQLP